MTNSRGTTLLLFCRDHAGGNEELCKLIKNVTVCGGDERIGALNKKIHDGDQLHVSGCC